MYSHTKSKIIQTEHTKACFHRYTYYTNTHAQQLIINFIQENAYTL